MPRIVRVFLLAAVAALVMTGCGNKGPLVLPDQQQPAKHRKGAAPAAKTPATPAQEPARTDQNGSGSAGADAQH